MLLSFISIIRVKIFFVSRIEEISNKKEREKEKEITDKSESVELIYIPDSRFDEHQRRKKNSRTRWKMSNAR